MMSVYSKLARPSAGLVAPLAGAITLALAADSGASAQQADRCVQIGNVSGYTVIDDRHFILQSGANNHFLVTTATRCSGLQYGIQLATSIRGNQRICQPFNEYVIPEDGWRCRIAAIEAVDSPDAARELVAARNTEAE